MPGEAQTDTSRAAAPGIAVAGPLGAIGALASEISNRIPSETIAVYVAVVALVGSPTWSANGGSTARQFNFASVDLYLWLAVAFGGLSSPIIVFFLTRLTARQAGKQFKVPGFNMFASFISFLAWATYLPNSIIQHSLALPTFAPAFVVIATQFGLWVAALVLDADGKLDDSITKRRVTASERDGTVLGVDSSTRGVNNDDTPCKPPSNVVDVLGLPSAVLASPQIIPIYLGNAWSAGEPAEVRNKCTGFIADFIASQTFRDLNKYGVGPAQLLPDITMPFSPPQQPATDQDIQNALTTLVSTGSIQPIAHRTIVVFFTQKGVRVSTSTGTTCEGICGYHQTSTSGVAYSVLPYVVEECGGCICAGQSPLDAQMSLICHELCEALTNPDPWGSDYGWKTPLDGDEIGDLCAGSITNCGGFNVQRIYINGQGCT